MQPSSVGGSGNRGSNNIYAIEAVTTATSNYVMLFILENTLISTLQQPTQLFMPAEFNFSQLTVLPHYIKSVYVFHVNWQDFETTMGIFDQPIHVFGVTNIIM